MTLNGVMAVTLRYFTEFGKPSLQKTICGRESIVFLVRVQCRRKESSRSLSHLLMSFLFYFAYSAGPRIPRALGHGLAFTLIRPCLQLPIMT